MPGSPPTNIADALTNPPPRARSNSLTPDRILSGVFSLDDKVENSKISPLPPPKDNFLGP